MNDASSSTPDHHPSDVNENSLNDNDLRGTLSSDDAGIIRQKKKAVHERKATMLDHLIRNMDVVIYAQLSTLYYMEYAFQTSLETPADRCGSCSLFKFLLRAVPHWFYFTPKPSNFTPQSMSHRPYVGIIFATNIICMLLHLMLAPPAAGEATRGYLHGGLVIDFVGQLSPVRRWRLLGTDLLLLALQILMLGMTVERRALKDGNNAAPNDASVREETRQDHDFEERGELRQSSSDIELQDLRHHSSARSGAGEDSERDDLLESESGPQGAKQHPLDPFYTGEHVIADLHILHTIRAQWRHHAANMSSSNLSATSSVQAAAVAAAAGRTLTYRLGEGMQRGE